MLRHRPQLLAQRDDLRMALAQEPAAVNHADADEQVQGEDYLLPSPAQLLPPLLAVGSSRPGAAQC